MYKVLLLFKVCTRDASQDPNMQHKGYEFKVDGIKTADESQVNIKSFIMALHTHLSERGAAYTYAARTPLHQRAYRNNAYYIVV